VLDLSQARPFQGVVPVAFRETEDAQAKIREAEAAVRFMKFAEQLKGVQDPIRQALGSCVVIPHMLANRIEVWLWWC
jgi:hypothetical protein